MANKGSLKAGSLLSLRNRIACPNVVVPMWACCTGLWVLPAFYKTETDATKACEKLLEENITAVPKRVNITITFPFTSGDIS